MKIDSKGRFSKKDEEGIKLTLNIPFFQRLIVWIVILAFLMPWIIILSKLNLWKINVNKFEDLMESNNENSNIP